MGDTSGDRFDLMALLPRLTRLGAVLNRNRLAERAMERLGIALDPPAVTVLVTVRMAGHSLRIGDIAKRMQVVGPHVTRLLHDLERRALVRRIPDPDDQRARLVELTPDGAAAADRYLGTVLDWFTDALVDWSDEDRRDLGRLLGRLVDDLIAHVHAIDDEP
jgi:DNA-binding MarR family transcriptional regulator